MKLSENNVIKKFELAYKVVTYTQLLPIHPQLHVRVEGIPKGKQNAITFKTPKFKLRAEKVVGATVVGFGGRREED